jgi:hypothetical protein
MPPPPKKPCTVRWPANTLDPRRIVAIDALCGQGGIVGFWERIAAE